MKDEKNENIKLIENENEKEKEDLKIIPKENTPYPKYYYSFNKVGSSHRFPSSLKLRLLKGIYYLDEHINFFSFLKLFFGLIFLVLPLVLIIFIVYSENGERNKYFFFPYFISVCLIIGSLFVFVIMKTADSCKMFGILTLSYERIYNLKIVKLILVNFFLLWLLFFCEDFVINFSLLKEQVTQSKTKEMSSKKFDEGTYLIRLLFIFLFWDLGKLNDNEYIYEKLGYFEYENSFFEDFQNTFNKMLIPVITLCIGGIIKIFFIKTKRGFLYFLLYSITLFFCFYIYLYDITKDHLNINEEEKDEYFKDSNYKYFEIVPITLIIIILIILNTKLCILDLVHKRYYSYETKTKNNFVVFLVLFSYLLNTGGYLLLLYLLYKLFLNKITPDFSLEKFNEYWFFVYLSLLLIFTGYAFPFGHYYFRLIYHSTAFECFDHLLKNKYYINSSGNLKRSSSMYIKRKMNKSF